jgi:uncharacterized protein (TIGR00266 family)
MKLILNMKNTGRSDYMRYEIKGGMMPVVEIILEAGESINCEKGAMVWMSPNMQMQTSGGGVGKMFTRAISGESMFRNTYTAQGGPGLIAFGSSFVGNIMAVEIGPGKEIICQKSAYLASTPGINLEIAFQKKIAGGFFGGEGFIMQRITGQGIVFLEIDGSVVDYMLAPGQQMVIDTGYLAMMDATCSLNAETVKGGAMNMFFGGEGFFNTVVTGPGKITLQTMPKSQLAAEIASMIPSK